jgi:hypothetical protein
MEPLHPQTTIRNPAPSITEQTHALSAKQTQHPRWLNPWFDLFDQIHLSRFFGKSLAATVGGIKLSYISAPKRCVSSAIDQACNNHSRSRENGGPLEYSFQLKLFSAFIQRKDILPETTRKSYQSTDRLGCSVR